MGEGLIMMQYGFNILSIEEATNSLPFLRKFSNKGDNRLACDEELFFHACLFYAERAELLNEGLNKLIWEKNN